MSQMKSVPDYAFSTSASSGSASAAATANEWNRILAAIRPKIDALAFSAWLEPTRFSGLRDGVLSVRVPNPTYKDWINAHYLELIQEAADQMRLPVQGVDFVPEKEPGSATAVESRKPEPVRSPEMLGSPLNAKYAFSNFVVGSSNQFAHAAAVQVAENPGRSYNPLFLYGGVGLGKTHLMQAIGHELRKQFPAWRVMYIPAERFMNEMVESLRDNMMTRFHQHFRNLDALLVDDVQFLSGKERMQEEFFHTFNTLHERGFQLVFSSDRPPKELEQIEERLRSRFEWGLIADLQTPDLETRQAILMKKAEAGNFDLPERVALFIATSVRSNIRELEGSLIRLMAYTSLSGMPPTESLAKQVLKDLLESETKRVTVELIQKVVCDHYGLRMQELKAKDNSRRVCLPRQIAMWLTREKTQLSLPDIARAFGDRHHTTVLHSVNKITQSRLVNRDLNRTLNKLLASLE